VGGSVQDDTPDDAAVLGVTMPDEPEIADVFEVWEENWEAVEMFLRLQTQWRVGMSGPVGLDYVAAEWLFRLYAIAEPASLLEDLQVMEAAALTAMAKREE
jgi:hypothetical protein